MIYIYSIFISFLVLLVCVYSSVFICERNWSGIPCVFLILLVLILTLCAGKRVCVSLSGCVCFLQSVCPRWVDTPTTTESCIVESSPETSTFFILLLLITSLQLFIFTSSCLFSSSPPPSSPSFIALSLLLSIQTLHPSLPLPLPSQLTSSSLHPSSSFHFIVFISFFHSFLPVFPPSLPPAFKHINKP